MIKKTLLVKTTIVLILAFSCQSAFAQEADENIKNAKRKVENALNSGDCDIAQRYYNTLKILSGNKYPDIERRISDCVPSEYVDLGLPSGILWKRKNEKSLYTYYEAIKTFGDELPSDGQWQELIDKCTWNWNELTESYTVVGPNGNHIILSHNRSGYLYCSMSLFYHDAYGIYWSSTPTKFDEPDLSDFDYAYILIYGSGHHNVLHSNGKCCSFSVRLVKNPHKK